ncbi:uncharacterized protein C227.17c [Salvia miltiorrhiza]|uniref:uncharacterized protein C227.17c n=1 Tax=Salvia miltiorrhiza TaxID=226208 RepID=UPI0025AC4EEF|nr:uncharacterized protein C227.17c [Salvia miltiorrhiza]XP_057786582.1 uncharacterized protein C227.17c [Salvia miltiorrhiza]
MNSENEDAPPKKRLSCTKYFDALYFCYSPFYQLQQYYRIGNLDTCTAKWGALYDCLCLKTKRASEVERILEEREKARPHIWTFRTRKEAERFWNKHYGHLYDKP